MAREYQDAHRRSLEDPEGFWRAAAAGITWDRPFDAVLDQSRPPFYRWFPGGQLNTAYNCLDRHCLAGHGARPALIYDSPVTATQKTFTYAELTDKVARVAGVLADLGLRKGDRAVIYMPMIPEAVMAMLACVRLGAVHSVVFGGFAAEQLAARIDDCRPKLLITASGGIEPKGVIAYQPLVEEALRSARHPPQACLVLKRPQMAFTLRPQRDHDWAQSLERARPHDCVPVAATDPCYILYTSGTTGAPKGLVRDTGGHAVALHMSMSTIYGMEPGETFWAASDVGWVVGHSYIVYAPLLKGCATVLYEGKPVGTPDAGAFWRVIAEHNVAVLFTAPTALRAIRQQDPEGALITPGKRPSLRALFLAGERSDPSSLHWASEKLAIPVIDHWWQTETGWTISGLCHGLEAQDIRYGAAGKPGLGWDLRVVQPDGTDAKPATIGVLLGKLPMPPGAAPSLWQNEQRFYDCYLKNFPGYYETGDTGLIDEDGYVFVLARTDDVINVAGHRLSTGEMEEVLAGHPAVAETAVVGVADKVKGQVPLGFVVIKIRHHVDAAQLQAELVAAVRQRIGPVAAFKEVVIVPQLPKTRSGKILRQTLRRLADGAQVSPPPTIDDPAVLPQIAECLTARRSLGWP